MSLVMTIRVRPRCAPTSAVPARTSGVSGAFLAAWQDLRPRDVRKARARLRRRARPGQSGCVAFAPVRGGGCARGPRWSTGCRPRGGRERPRACAAAGASSGLVLRADECGVTALLAGRAALPAPPSNPQNLRPGPPPPPPGSLSRTSPTHPLDRSLSVGCVSRVPVGLRGAGYPGRTAVCPAIPTPHNPTHPLTHTHNHTHPQPHTPTVPSVPWGMRPHAEGRSSRSGAVTVPLIVAVAGGGEGRPCRERRPGGDVPGGVRHVVPVLWPLLLQGPMDGGIW